MTALEPKSCQSKMSRMDVDSSNAPNGNSTNMEKPKRRILVSPWESFEDLYQVYEWIYGSGANEESKQKALSEMKVWNLRRVDLCPAAILATSVLLEIQLLDDEKLSTTQVQALYSNGLTRFFNFMSSIMQTRNMRSMYETAAELGLKSFIVDIRHLCAHGQVLPPVEVFRNSTKYCLQWLNDYYWAKQISIVSNVDASEMGHKSKTEFDEKVTDLFSIYDSTLECYCKGALNIKSAKRYLNGKRFTRIKTYGIEKNLENLTDILAAVVKDLEVLVKKNGNIIWDISEIYVEAFLKSKFIFSLSTANLNDVECLNDVMRSLFNLMVTYRFIENLFYALLAITESVIANVQRVASASFWATQIITFYKNFRNKNELNSLLYSSWSWNITREFMHEHAFIANKFSAKILMQIMPMIEPALDATDRLVYEELLQSMFESSEEVVENLAKTADNLAIYTAEDILENVEVTETTLNDISTAISDNKTFGIWRMVQDNENQVWKECPLGKLYSEI